MRYFLNKVFQRRMKDYDFSEEKVCETIKDVQLGRATFLGQHLYKIRVAAEEKGRSGGFRVIFFWMREKHIIFCDLFSKNAKEDLSYKEIKALYIVAKEFKRFTDIQIKGLINDEELKEIRYDQA